MHGLALAPEPHETLYESLQLGCKIASDHRCDISQRNLVSEIVRAVQPEVIFHLAAQPLVRKSFDLPVETFHTNVMGTVHILDAVRNELAGDCAIVVVTTDKCYENREWLHGYRETDAMGGYDPYSASKGCAELVVSAFRNSFFSNSNIKLSSARAGNVIGGGDWATDRIVPDIFRSIFSHSPIVVRNKQATRPWQHVLEPLSGYLWLASRLLTDSPTSSPLASAFNFGPPLMSNRTVAELVHGFLRHLEGSWIDGSEPDAPHEASKLNLSTDKAFHLLGWHSTWDFETTVIKTLQWYSAVQSGGSAIEQTNKQIDEYQSAAQLAKCPWAV